MYGEILDTTLVNASYQRNRDKEAADFWEGRLLQERLNEPLKCFHEGCHLRWTLRYTKVRQGKARQGKARLWGGQSASGI